jgi:hypothetical protein
MRTSWVLLAILALPAVAEARSDSEYAYPYERVWTAAVRLLRVDLSCPINEKDKDEGYFFFEYPGETGPIPGSIEFIRARVNGVEGVKVIIQVPAMPSYFERMVLEKLGRKLTAEFGRPLSGDEPSGAAPAPAPAAGASAGKEASAAGRKKADKQPAKERANAKKEPGRK